MRLSLQARVMAGTGAVLLLVILLAAGLDARSSRNERHAALQTRLDLVIGMQARTLAQAVWDFNSAQIDAVLASLAEDPDFASAEILDAKGKSIAALETKDPALRAAPTIAGDRPIEFQDGKTHKAIGRLVYKLSEAGRGRPQSRPRESRRQSRRDDRHHCNKAARYGGGHSAGRARPGDQRARDRCGLRRCG
jgi:hypothetical protein